MSIQISKAIVRFAAVATVLACGCCLALLAVATYTESFSQSRLRSNMIAFLVVCSVLPILFIWESVRAWRHVPKGIESLSVIWALSGVAAFFYGLFRCWADFRIQSVIVTAVGVLAFLCALWLTKQGKRLHDVA